MARDELPGLRWLVQSVAFAAVVASAAPRRLRRHGQRGHRLEPDRGEHARRAPRAGGWGTAGLPDQHGDGHKAPSTTRSTRSSRSIIDRICSSAVSPRPPRRRPLSQQRRTWSSRTSSRPCPRASRSRPGRACCSRSRRNTPPRSSAIPDSPRSRPQGVAAGNAAAEAMIAAREGDGRFGPSQWVPNPAPGHWQPLVDPATGQPILDPTPWVGGVKPFLMQSSSQFRTAGPLALGSAAYAAEFNEVKALGSINSAVRTADPDLHRSLVAEHTRRELERRRPRPHRTRRRLDIADSARLLAMRT